MANGNRPNGNSGSITLLTVLIVVAVLYFGRMVFVPLALSVLLAFLLAPVVSRLQRWGLGRIPSAILVVTLFLVIIGFVGALMTTQLTDLARKLPGYQTNIHRKVESVRASGGGLINRISRVVADFSDSLTPSRAAATPRNQSEEKPVPVEIRRSAFSPLDMIQKVLGSLLNVMVTAGLVLVFVIFMLIEQTGLRDRLIRLGGARRVNATTRMLDDASQRVSRYLLAQLVINSAFGMLAGIGLYFMKVPNPFLWGLVAALLRYIPYLGIWIAAIMPAALAFAVEPGWVKAPLVFAIYFGIDLIMYNFVEPLLYGNSTGLSPLAILVAAVFWTWLWGAVGLLLATPLTVCVVVLGRHIPQLWFLRILLSDEPVLRPETRFYQRLLAMDLEEATEIAEEFLKGKSLEEFYDGIMIPALSLAEEDRHQGRLDEARQRFVFQNSRILVEDLAERADELTRGEESREQPNEQQHRPEIPAADAPPEVICIPARDEADEVAAAMLVQLLQIRGVPARTLTAGMLVGELLESVNHQQPPVVCVLAVPPFGYAHARYLCRRLRDQAPDVKLVGAILTEQRPEDLKQRQPQLVADELAISLRQTLAAVLPLIHTGNNKVLQPALSAA
ncbi:MAG TPA: AI-2E family transporter [Candidatus Limnocylindrales bacterium]|nr:AI-2E family transporter [Candidatus Limnocylindrales bacterium]